MSPPGIAPTTEPRVERISAESDTALSTRTQQMRFLVAELGITRPQAHSLIKAYELDQRDARRRDAHEFVREEFGPWLRRRGDLLVVRSKAQHAWRVRS
jgi:hypothetical protein